MSRVFVALVAALTSGMLPATADSFVFPDPALPFSVSYGGSLEVDASNLRISDTADGFKLHGTLSFTTPDLGFPSSAYVEVRSKRYFDAPWHTPVLLSSHISGTFSTAGEISITSLSSTTFLFPTPSGFGPCGAFAAYSPGSTVIAPGAFSASFAGNNVNPRNPCRTEYIESLPPDFRNSLDGTLGISIFYSGAGTATFDFGNSVISEGLVAPVPEPSSLTLLATCFACIFWRLRRRRRAPQEAL